MRRSTRIRWQIPIQITSVDPRVPFNETCETVAVNAHGCGVICHTPLEKATPVKLGLLPDNREVMAHIADVVKLGEDGRAWLLGLQLDVPANVWGVRNPPHDWEKPSAGQESEAAAVPLAASAAAGAGASGTAVSTATLAAPEFSLVTPAPPANPPVAVQSVATAEAPKVEVAKPATTANSNGGSGQRAADAGRGNGAQPAARPSFGVRDRDWADLRKQMEEHLQDLMWQVDDQVETKLEHWKEQMVDTEARLESLCQLQDRLQAHITVLSEIVKEKVKPEEESGASPGAADKPETAATAESAAVTASQVEEIRQLQQWMQSLINLLPQAVEQHASEAVGAAEQRLHGQAEEQLDGMRKQLAELHERLETAAAAQNSPAESEAAEEERRRASEYALRAASEDLKESLQKSLREESEKLQQGLKQAQQVWQEEAEQLRKLQEEAAGRAAQRSDEAGQRIEQLKAAETALRGIGEQLRAELHATLQSELEAQKQQLQKAATTQAAQQSEEAAQQTEHFKAAEAAVREIGESFRSELRATIQTELETQKQQISQAAAAVEEKSTRLQAQITELTAGTEEARRAREALESVVASLTQAASQQIKEDVAAGLQTISSEGQRQAQSRDKEFAEKLAEAQRLGAAAQEQLAQLAKQASELSARFEEGQRNREALQSRMESAVRAAEQKVESSAAGILRQVGSQTEQEIKRLEEQVSAQQKKLDELTQQRQQELQSALDTHMAALRSSSESMLRKVSEELRGSLNTHLKEEFASQRHI